jgi:hypothetical protein
LGRAAPDREMLVSSLGGGTALPQRKKE